MNEQKNLIFFVLVFLAVMVGWHYFYEAPKTVTAPTAQQQVAASGPAVPLTAAPVAPADRKEVIQASARVQIDTPSLKGSINLKGGLLDDLSLEKYTETPNKTSPHIVLLMPEGTQHPYFAQFGWATADTSITMPDGNTIWTADRTEITHTSGPVTLSWTNPQGILFERRISVDENYLFTVEQSVTNHTTKPIQITPYGQVTRTGTPPVQGYYILHEGPLGYIDNKLKEYNYTNLQEKNDIRTVSEGGWIGITDKYWLAALIPDQKTKSDFYFQDNRQGVLDNYHTGYLGEPLTIAPAQKADVKTHLFAGAKVLSLLDDYEEHLGAKHLDLAVDFGWFYIITKPLFYLLDMIYGWLGNLGLAIILLTVLIKLAFYPLANKSYRSMARMKELQPKVEKLKERFADDKMRMNQEMMDLYKKEKVNPASGCLPIFIQIPVFFALYKVLFVTIEMRQAPFYGWIHDLSAPDPTTIFNAFGLIPWDPPSALLIGALPIMMGVSMWVQQKLNPAPMDPIQQKMFMIMPVMMTYLLAAFPSGLVLYWTCNNVLSIAQQWMIMSSHKRKAKAA
jgi:YidC/Oxa1 family membrane protein insertase